MGWKKIPLVFEWRVERKKKKCFASDNDDVDDMECQQAEANVN